MTGTRKTPDASDAVVGERLHLDERFVETGRLEVAVFLSANPRPAKMLLNTGLRQLAGRASREAGWGSDGASLEYVSDFSVDPIAADRNLYRYCENGPTTHIDPTGLEEKHYADKQWDADECVRKLLELEEEHRNGKLTDKKYLEGIENIRLHCRDCIPEPSEDSNPPKLPKVCSGTGVVWTAHWRISANGPGWILGSAKSSFDATGKDDSGCVYIENGNGIGAMGGIFTGWPKTSFDVFNEPADVWPITLGSRIHSFSSTVMVGPVSIGYNTGSAGDFSSWYLGSLSGVALGGLAPIPFNSA